MPPEKGGRGVDAAAGDLYSTPPQHFTARRSEKVREARAAGRRDEADALSKLRRPTAGAFLVNILVHRDKSAVERLLALAADLRRAQENLEGSEMRRLSQRVRDEVGNLARRAEELAHEAGVEVTAPARAELQSTLEAATADREAADAVRSGRLTSALHYTGFGLEGVDAPADAAQKRSTDGERTPARRRRPERSRLNEQSREEELEQELGEAERSLSQLQEAIAATEHQLAELRREREAAGERLRKARARRRSL